MSSRILLASLFSLSLVAQPAPPPPQNPGPRGPAARPMARMAERAAFLAHHLKLTDAQKTQIKDIHQKHRETIQGKRKAAMEARQAFHKAAQDPAATTDQLRSLHRAAADRQFEVVMEQRAVRQESRAVLTPEQRTEADRLQALAAEHRAFRMERMHKFMQGRQGMGPGGPRRGPGGPGQGPGSSGDALD